MLLHTATCEIFFAKSTLFELSSNYFMDTKFAHSFRNPLLRHLLFEGLSVCPFLLHGPLTFSLPHTILRHYFTSISMCWAPVEWRCSCGWAHCIRRWPLMNETWTFMWTCSERIRYYLWHFLSHPLYFFSFRIWSYHTKNLLFFNARGT